MMRYLPTHGLVTKIGSGDGVLVARVSTDVKEKKQMLMLCVKEKKPVETLNQVTNWQLSLFSSFCFGFSIRSLHGTVMHLYSVQLQMWEVIFVKRPKSG